MNIIFLGAPGAGKGTQAAMLAEKIGIVHISTGDIFRDHILSGTALGIKAKEYIDIGNLAPDDLTQQILGERLSVDDCQNGFIIDGFPRTISQSEFFIDYMKKLDRTIDFVLNLDVTDDILMERISGRRVCRKCGASYHLTLAPPVKHNICNNCDEALVQRADDNEEALKTRLKVYHGEAEPIIDFFKQRGVFHNIQGKQCVNDTASEVFQTVGANK